MTTYCTPADVRALTGMAYTETSHPTLANVQRWCRQYAAELDAALDVAGIKVPVAADVSPDTFAAIGQYVAYKVAAICEASAYIGGGAGGGDNRSSFFNKEYDNALKAILKGETRRFPDAERNANTAADASALADSVSIDGYGGQAIEPPFRLAMKF